MLFYGFSFGYPDREILPIIGYNRLRFLFLASNIGATTSGNLQLLLGSFSFGIYPT
ncbi:MAG: hypothetical protein ACI9YL_002194, partial [Luteibaculaceae bacterium]